MPMTIIVITVVNYKKIYIINTSIDVLANITAVYIQLKTK